MQGFGGKAKTQPGLAVIEHDTPCFRSSGWLRRPAARISFAADVRKAQADSVLDVEAAVVVAPDNTGHHFNRPPAVVAGQRGAERSGPGDAYRIDEILEFTHSATLVADSISLAGEREQVVAALEAKQAWVRTSNLECHAPVDNLSDGRVELKANLCRGHTLEPTESPRPQARHGHRR
jgi:hypothetical protein